MASKYTDVLVYVLIFYLVMVLLETEFRGNDNCQRIAKPTKDVFLHDSNPLLYKIISEKRLDTF